MQSHQKYRIVFKKQFFASRKLQAFLNLVYDEHLAGGFKQSIIRFISSTVTIAHYSSTPRGGFSRKAFNQRPLSDCISEHYNADV